MWNSWCFNKRLCLCLQPTYRLFKFPSILRNGEKREKWIGQLRRENRDKTTWKPCDNDRVCSDHFFDGEPTVSHPFPELKLSYEKQIPQPRRQIFEHPGPPKKARKHIIAETVQTSSPFRTPPRETKSNTLNFHRNTSTVCCQVVKSVAVAFIRTY